jgi:alpha/beta superfamily hydrolase
VLFGYNAGVEEELITLAGTPALEARFRRAGTNLAIIAAPHPLQGGDLDNPVVEALANGFSAAGVSTLRFNYRGVGASEGEASGSLQDAVEDYRRAVKWAHAGSFGWLVFGGYSFGALAAIHTHLEGLDCLAIAAVSPPHAALRNEQMEKLDCVYCVCHGDRDALVDSSKTTELLTHVQMAQSSLIAGADHFFVGHLAAITKFSSGIAHYLAATEGR